MWNNKKSKTQSCGFCNKNVINAVPQQQPDMLPGTVQVRS